MTFLSRVSASECRPLSKVYAPKKIGTEPELAGRQCTTNFGIHETMI